MAVIEFEHIYKTYQLGAHQTSLREALAHIPRRLVRRSPVQKDQLFWALKDVSFEVEPGEVLGIIGRNGAGKSTILKLLSKVTFPTSGVIHTKGRLAALIELGAGFHPDLTGRENVYLNGAVLGLKKKEIDAQFEDIVEFAGLEQFIDTPIKRYSSGMYVRLAFAVAAHVKADILLIDEVLSVGDMSFQQKSMAKMNELRTSGATIIFVSHNLTAVRSFCERVILLDAGKIAAVGDPAEAIETYKKLEEKSRQTALEKLLSQNPDPHALQTWIEQIEQADNPQMPDVELLNPTGCPVKEFAPYEPVKVRCHFIIPKEIRNPVGMIRVRRRTDGFVCFTWYTAINERTTLKGEGFFEVTFDELRLVPGAYTLEANIHNYENWEEGVFGPHQFFVIQGKLPSHGEGIFEPVAMNISLSYI